MKRREEKAGLHVLFEVHGHTMALPVAPIIRMALVADVKAHPVGEGVVVEAGPHTMCGWDIGLLFGLPRVDSAWLLLDLSGGKREGGVALRTGPCTKVRAVERLCTFRSALFSGRGGAVSGAFLASDPEAEEPRVGWLLDPTKLLSPAEMARAEGWMEAHRSSAHARGA